MKTWTLIRHAKPNTEFKVNNRDYPLAEKGILNAHEVAKKLKQTVQSPYQKVFTSPAARALHTCIIFMQHLEIDFSDLNVIESFYDFEGNQVLNYIEKLPNEFDCIMTFGHNNACLNLVNQFSQQNVQIGTCCVSILKFNVQSWSEITTEKADLVSINKS